MTRSFVLSVVLLLVAGCSNHQDASPPAPAPAGNPADRRVDELLAQMTLDEKLGQLNQYANGHDTGIGAGKRSFPELIAAGQIGSIMAVGAKATNDMQRIAVEHSRLKIPILFAWDVIHGYRTTFPIPLALAATWDPELVERTARVAAREAAADGIRWTFSPMVDIARDARWGRIMEGAGEDPYLGSLLAKAYVRGYQGAHLSDPTSLAACAKHYVGYGAVEAGRDYNTATIAEPELRDMYLPPFRATVDAGIATMMTAFNAINRVPATANPHTMGILRKEWNFGGLVVSDWGSIGDSIPHGVAIDGATAARKALLVGVDMDMESSLYITELPGLIKAGRIPIGLVDDAVRRVLRLKLALGLFEHPYADEKAAPAPLDRALAKQAALESFVLLANRGNMLPLASTVHKLALIGPLGDDATDMLGSWAAVADTAPVTTLRAALSHSSFEVSYEKGVDLIGGSDAGIAAAVAAARRADVVLLAVGESGPDMTGEAASRTRLDLPGLQPRLVDAIAATGKPIVLLVFSGHPLTLVPYVDRAAAIVQAWHPGIEAGPALVDLLTGAASPSGRLTVSMPRSVGQEPLYYNALGTGKPIDHVDLSAPPTPETKYRSRYIDEDNAPLYPFGYGLSYTTFSYGPVTASANTASAKALAAGQAKLTVRATVTNTGKRDGVEVAQLYIRMRGTSVALPVRQLEGFQRVALHAGESKDVELTLGRDELAFWGIDGKRSVEPCALSVWIAPDARSGTPLELVIGD